jgi:hypothetical protein
MEHYLHILCTKFTLESAFVKSQEHNSREDSPSLGV